MRSLIGGSRALSPSLSCCLSRWGVVIVAVDVGVMGGCTSKDTTSADEYVSAGTVAVRAEFSSAFQVAPRLLLAFEDF